MLYIATDFLSCFDTSLNTFLIVMPRPVYCFAVNVMIPLYTRCQRRSILVVVLTVPLVTSYKSMFVSLILVQITLIQQYPLTLSIQLLLLRRHEHCTSRLFKALTQSQTSRFRLMVSGACAACTRVPVYWGNVFLAFAAWVLVLVVTWPLPLLMPSPVSCSLAS